MMQLREIHIERIDMRTGVLGLLVLVAATGQSEAYGQDLSAPARFEAELRALADYDRSVQDDPVGTLFIGSSSIRLWDVRADFAPYRPLNHGFGGATVLDVLANYDLLTANHAPETIIVYVGENDIVQGRAANAVAADVIVLLSRLRSDFPKARLLYLSMKSSPARWARRSAFEQANRRIRAQSEDAGGFDYVDVSASLLSETAPDLACFSADGIHLSVVGYRRWRTIIGAYLANRETNATFVADLPELPLPSNQQGAGPIPIAAPLTSK